METDHKTLSDFPDYQQALDLLIKTQIEAAATESEIDALRLKMTNRGPLTRAQKAEAWLRGVDIGEEQLRPWREQIERLSEKRRILARAEQMQKTELDRVRDTASKTICEDCRSDYVKVLRKLADATREFAQANYEAHEFIRRLQGEGISTGHLPHVFVTWPGSPDDPYSNSNLLLKEIRTSYPEVFGLPREPTPQAKPSLLKKIKQAVAAPSDDDWAA